MSKTKFKPSAEACDARHCDELKWESIRTARGVEKRRVCMLADSGSKERHRVPGNLHCCPKDKQPAVVAQTNPESLAALRTGTRPIVEADL